MALTVIFVTHDMNEALLLGDRIAVLQAGQIARIGTPEDLVRDPGSESVARFLRAPRRQAARIDALLSEGPT